ncbi:MAG: hypothetical protein J7530_19445 [Novosphingobium sp.]|nr:hypothetical protein [Novosphingobium sp.]
MAILIQYAILMLNDSRSICRFVALKAFAKREFGKSANRNVFFRNLISDAVSEFSIISQKLHGLLCEVVG